MGSVDMEIGVLFADVRGFTTMAEAMTPREVAELMNRFYASAIEILAHSPPDAGSRLLDLRGKGAPEPVRVIDRRAVSAR
jgi:hypothetical protein